MTGGGKNLDSFSLPAYLFSHEKRESNNRFGGCLDIVPYLALPRAQGE